MTSYVLATCGLLLILALAFLTWVVAYRFQKTSIVDIFWSLFIFSAALFYFMLSGQFYSVAYVYLVLVGLWAVRLSAHIGMRARGHEEDPRYRALRLKWGADEKNKMLIFYFQQGAAAWVFSLPFLILFSSLPHDWGAWQSFGFVIWFCAFIGEALSDYQLYQFKKDQSNQGRVCRVGFWNYSRHPNYFFEWLNWVAYAFLALPHQGGWIALVCPILMYHFLNKVSGVPLAEQQALKSRSTEYAEYQRVTSAFFPWLPKKQKGQSSL